MDREKFSKIFEKRQRDFLNSLSVLGGVREFSWLNYTGKHITDEDGFVSHIAELVDDNDHTDTWESFENYVKFLSGQGFTVEINIEWGIERVTFHIASWEDEEEIEWPEEINSAFISRWLPVSSPNSLGL